MTNLTTIHAAKATGFANREWREVVVKEEVLGILTTGIVVDVEFLIGRCEGANPKSLGLTTDLSTDTVKIDQKAYTKCVARMQAIR